MIRDSRTRLQVPWVESPFFDELLPAAGLSSTEEEQARAFHRDGYLILENLFPATLMDRARAELAPLFAPGAEDSRRHGIRFHDAWQVCPAVREIACHRPVHRLLERLYGRRPIPFQTLSFQRGSEQRPHADTIHFNSVPRRFMCGVWVALEDVDERNGALVYYPGSHRLPDLDFDVLDLRLLNPRRPGPRESRTYEDYDLYEEVVGELLRRHGFEERRLSVSKGSALIWSAGLVHGGGPILEPGSTRWSQVTHFFFADCLYYQPLLSSPVTGDLHLKKITDVCTGEEHPGAYRGMRLPDFPVDDSYKLFLEVEGDADVLRWRASSGARAGDGAGGNEDLRRELEESERARRRLEELLAAVAASPSYRLGRALTAPLRWLRGRQG